MTRIEQPAEVDDRPAVARPPTRARRLRLAVLVLALAGLGIALYLTYVHYHGGTVVCAISHGCETVQHSSYAKLGGVPVAVIGLGGYALILASLLVPGEAGLMAGALFALVGFAFSAYLTYRELFTIDAICQWCVGSAVIMTALAVLTCMRVLAADPAAPSGAGGSTVPDGTIHG